jgi:multiple sugar transport system permease protein
MSAGKRSIFAWYKNKSATAREDFWTGLLCLSPAALISFVFVVIPIAFSLYLSFHEWDLLRPNKPFVGLANYQKLFRSAEFWGSLRNTFFYTLSVVIIGSTLSLILAVLLNRKMRGLTFFRTAYFMPVVTSTVAISVVWTWIYNPQYGLMNALLSWLHLPVNNWLVDPRWAMPAVIIMSIWKNVGYHMVIFLAGLQDIPDVYYEAASIDGANAWQRFRHITWPLLRSTTGFVLITNTIFSFQVFGPVYVMTKGGPMRSTTVLVYLLYQRAFEFREMGYASAMAWVLFVIIMAFSLIQAKYTSKGVNA